MDDKSSEINLSMNKILIEVEKTNFYSGSTMSSIPTKVDKIILYSGKILLSRFTLQDIDLNSWILESIVRESISDKSIVVN